MNKYLDTIFFSSMEAILKVMISPYAENLEFIQGHIKYSNYYEVVDLGGKKSGVSRVFVDFIENKSSAAECEVK